MMATSTEDTVVPGSNGEEHVSKSINLGETTEFSLHRCKQELIKFYKHRMSKVHLLPWCEESRDMDEIYVTLVLEEKRGKKPSLLQHNEDLVTLTTSDLPATRVLVKGVAGSGKSTLLAKLAYDWAQQKSDSPLSNYDLLFVISLREVEKDGSLIDAIFQQILAKDTKISKSDLHTFIENHPSQIVVLLDGFDEYGYDVAKTGKENGIDEILHFKALRDCRVIVSTRPHKHLIDKHQSNYSFVSLFGFSPKNVILYMTKFFNENTEMVNEMKHRLKESDILTSLSTIPVILMMMCLLWEEDQKLPSTQSELYKEFALYLWRKYCIKQGKEVEGDSLETEFEKSMCALGEKAFVGLCPKGNFMEENLIFTENDFTPTQYELGCETGLITGERLRSRLKMISSITFLHKSFQEYCAAVYWADMFDTNLDTFYSILKQIDTWDVMLCKIELLKFCCGLVGKAGRVQIVHHVIQLFKGNNVHFGYEGFTDDRNHLLPILSLLNESQITPSDDSVTTQQHGQATADSTHGEQHQSRGTLSLTQALQSLFSKTKVGLKVCSNPPQSLPIFHTFVKSAFALSSLSTINSLRFSECPVSSLDVITDTLQCMPDVQEVSVSLEQLRRESMACDAEDKMKLLGEQTATSSELIAISISVPLDPFGTCENMSIGPIVKALSASSHCSHFTHLLFPNVTFNSTHMAHLLSKSTQLKKLVLEENELTPDNVVLILKAIRGSLEHLSLQWNHIAEAIWQIAHIMTPHLQALMLDHTRLNVDHITMLSQSIHKAVNLSALSLEGNTVGMSIVPFVQQLQYCTKLSKLELQSTNIAEQGIIGLATGFVFLSNLSYLDIRGNYVGNSSIHAVFKHLHNLAKLEDLRITATIDNQCSNLVKGCLCAIGKTIPGTRSCDINIESNRNRIQVLKAACNE